MASCKEVKENLLNIIKDKKILFLENDYSLHGLDSIESFLMYNDISYTCMFNVKRAPFDYIRKNIQASDVIMFQTQWVYEISNKIKEYVFKMNKKKIFIECYIGDPSWYYKPDVIHDVYVLKSYREDHWEFYKLSDKPYWEYKNKFDK